MTAPSRSVECKAARATLEEATNEIVVSGASIYEIGNKARLGCKARQVVRGRVLPQLHILLWKKRGAWSLGGMEKEMTQKTTLYSSLTQLGRSTPLPTSPETAELEKVANPHDGTPYCVRFSAPEFTSLCPVTGQPDFAHLVIDYVPGKWLVESKSLKLYLGSFRDHGAFHEECTVSIGRRLVDLLAPKWLRIGGYWYPRGGIPIDVFYQTGPVPQNVWVPDQGVPPYRGRG